MTLENQLSKVWQGTFLGNAGGGVGLAGSGNTPGSGGAAASNGGGDPIQGVNTANTVLGSPSDDPETAFFGGLKRLRSAVPAPGAGTKKPVTQFPFDLTANFGDVNVSQNVSQPTTVNQAPGYAAPSGGARLQGGVQFNQPREGGWSHGAYGGGVTGTGLSGSPEQMAGQLANSDYYTQAMFMAWHSDNTARNAEARGMWHDAEFARRNAQQWRDAASRVGPGNIPKFGQAPQITQTYGTWLGLVSGGQMGQVPQMQVRMVDPRELPAVDIVENNFNPGWAGPSGSVMRPFGGGDGVRNYGNLAPQQVDTSVSGRIISNSQQSQPSGYQQPIYDNTNYDHDDWIDDDNIQWFDPQGTPHTGSHVRDIGYSPGGWPNVVGGDQYRQPIYGVDYVDDMPVTTGRLIVDGWQNTLARERQAQK